MLVKRIRYMWPTSLALLQSLATMILAASVPVNMPVPANIHGIWLAFASCRVTNPPGASCVTLQR